MVKKVFEIEKGQSDIARQTLTIPVNKEGLAAIGNAVGTFRLIQITDCHLGENQGEKLAGMDTDASLDYVLEQILKERCNDKDSTPHLLLATGDLSSNGATEAYIRLESKLAQLPMPSVWLPGNHDSRDLMIATVGIKKMPRVVRAGNWALCLLDSTVPGQVGGQLGVAETEALKLAFKAIPQHCYIMVCFHHQPVPVGSAWLDAQQLADSDRLIEVLALEKRLRAVVWGHVHQDFTAQDSRLPGVELIASPSTCVQFAPKTQDFKLDDNQPGYRWFELHSDGRIETGVSRVDGQGLTMDLASSGY
jgi:Icc protein